MTRTAGKREARVKRNRGLSDIIRKLILLDEAIFGFNLRERKFDPASDKRIRWVDCSEGLYPCEGCFERKDVAFISREDPITCLEYREFPVRRL
jgi:hypothetical protein